MNVDLLIRTYYSELSRDLLIYIITIAVAAFITWSVWYRVRIKNRHGWLAGALVLTIVGGALITAAYSYRVGIPAKLNADLVAAQTNLDLARQTVIYRYGSEPAVAHFRMLAIIWAVISSIALAAMLTYRRPVVLGICSAVLFLCAASFVLDLTAFMRDLVYAAQWMEMKP
ncbi:hypothetical protein [Nostoc sp. MS1]|uniref:hypothetical protein n=1 Tax=Nostoc sp. MS1 TaxID=2764711 RepID=UPI001CC47821|nr:hypothetical protein [Nostoc sp. MS1]BCL38224.1 hypothetical protein NSMS1_46710 [Nostoc sp. MS1]